MKQTIQILILTVCWGIPNTGLPASLAFDHVWIHVTSSAPEASALSDAGFKLPPNGGRPHSGLGTASTAVMFHNAYLELIWVEEPTTLERVAPDFAGSLLGGANASPFGIGLRRATDRDELPFESTPIVAEWINEGTSIEVARQPDDEKLYPPVFVVPRYMGFPEWDEQFADMQTNQLELRNITQVRIYGPELSVNPSSIDDHTVPGFIQFIVAESHLLELVFDMQAKNEVLDLRPTLPLVIRY